MPAYFLPGEGAGPRPTAIFVCGLDTTKELWFLRARRQFAERGISSLFIDTPGIGEALRLRKLVTRADYEKPIAAAVDFLQARSDVDADAIGLMAQASEAITWRGRQRSNRGSRPSWHGVQFTTIIASG